MLIAYTGEATRVRIPAEIGGIPVKILYEPRPQHLYKSLFGGKSIDVVQIPESVTYIGKSVFYKNRLGSVTIPKSVTYIGEEAFEGNQLASITIPESVTFIGNYAFRNNKITSVTIESKNLTLGISVFFSMHARVAEITIVSNVQFNGSLGVIGTPTSFEKTYNDGGKKAGTYIGVLTPRTGNRDSTYTWKLQ